jgi:hypothetical protein
MVVRDGRSIAPPRTICSSVVEFVVLARITIEVFTDVAEQQAWLASRLLDHTAV